MLSRTNKNWRQNSIRQIRPRRMGNSASSHLFISIHGENVRANSNNLTGKETSVVYLAQGPVFIDGEKKEK